VRRLIDAGAVDYVNYDVSEGGGVTDWRRVASICAASGIRMAHHEEAQIASQLLSAVPHGTYAECFAHPDRDPIWQRMWVNRPQAKNGFIKVLNEPGFSIELDEKMVKRYRVN
jgi:L-alanine-DL-glutamate epimerase-like enolase superfamily enzyme